MTKSLENKFNDAVQSVEPSQEFTEKLWKEIRATSHPIPTPRHVSHWRWIPVMAILALVVVFLVIPPKQVWASLRGLFDFLPDIGLVQDDETTLYLTEPVSLEQEGATLTINQVVSDANQTVISYRIDNLPNGGQYCAYNINHLLLPDGKNLLPTGGGLSNEEGSVQARIQFFTLPEGVTQATLYTSVDLDNPEVSSCSIPEWKVDFSLSTTKPADVELLPVVESTAESNAKASDSGVMMSIDKNVTLDDGYILYGSFQPSNHYWRDVYPDFETMTAQDANGKEIPLEQEEVLQNQIFNTDNADRVFAIKVATKDFAPPLTLHVQNLRIMAIYAPEGFPVFTFDAGPDPQVGQSWEINREAEVDGIKINIQKVEVVQEPTDQGRDDSLEKGYAITITKSSAQFSGGYFCKGQGEGMPDYGFGYAIEQPNTFIYYYSGGLPYGSVTCSIYDAVLLLPGNWEIEWQPPANGE